MAQNFCVIIIMLTIGVLAVFLLGSYQVCLNLVLSAMFCA